MRTRQTQPRNKHKHLCQEHEQIAAHRRTTTIELLKSLKKTRQVMTNFQEYFPNASENMTRNDVGRFARTAQLASLQQAHQ